MRVRGKRPFWGAITAVLLMQIVFAHGDLQHVLGTITEASPTSLTVRTAENRTVVVELDSKTQFTKAGANIAAQDLKPGDRVVIHAKKDGNRLVARTVQIGSGKTHS